MTTRYFVYNIDSTMEDFVASFADRSDADNFAEQKFGEKGYVSDIALHDKIKLGYAKPVRKRR